MRKHLASLDGLRGVAAIAVVAKHFQNFSRINLHAQQASTAVDLFFVLSGYVIARAYEARLADGLSWRSYMGLRLARLYPSIFGALVISVCIWLTAGGRPYPQLLLQFFLLPVVIGPLIFAGDLFPLDDPQWSLFWELVVNGAHAAITRWLTPVRIGLIMAASFVGLILACRHFGWLDVGWTRRSFWCAIPRTAWGFFAGVLIYRFTQKGWRLPQVPYWILVLALVVCMIRWAPSAKLYWARDMLLVTIILPAIVAFAVHSRVPDRWVGPATWLGAVSYPLYTLHVPLLRGFRWLLMASPSLPIWERRILWLVVFVAVVGFAALYEHYYDAPIRTLLARRRARHTSAQAEPPPQLQPRPEAVERRPESAFAGVSRAGSN
ncbi:MAG TPA: acyltransferase [Caulobacteraceae bacterium]|nr:acyltransferase [Caulobacteraceae bacterium]